MLIWNNLTFQKTPAHTYLSLLRMITNIDMYMLQMTAILEMGGFDVNHDE